jgi:hypothetical protein
VVMQTAAGTSSKSQAGTRLLRLLVPWITAGNAVITAGWPEDLPQSQGRGENRWPGCHGVAYRASSGMRTWASGLPQPVTGSQPSPAW